MAFTVSPGAIAVCLQLDRLDLRGLTAVTNLRRALDPLDRHDADGVEVHLVEEQAHLLEQGRRAARPGEEVAGEHVVEQNGACPSNLDLELQLGGDVVGPFPFHVDGVDQGTPGSARPSGP